MLVSCLKSCSRPWSVREVALVPCVGCVVVALSVLRVLLFVYEVSMLRECKDSRLTAMLVWDRWRYGYGECGV